MALKLSLPNLSARSAEEIELHPGKVKAWLSDLPLLNVAETSRKLFSMLSLYNRTELDDSTRRQLFELYRAPVRQISLELLKQYIGLPLPLPENTKKTADQNQQFQMEMAHGYKRLVANTEAKNQPLANDKQRAELSTAIQRAIRHLTGVLAAAYETYSPCPAGVWREIHELYRYGETLGIALMEVDDPLNQTVPHGSIDHAYKQALLLSLSDPYHMPTRSIDKIHHYLDRFAPLAQLTHAGKPLQPTCQFLIEPDSDRAGAVYTGAALETPGHPLLLNTVELARRAHTQLSVLQSNGMPPEEGLQANFFREAGTELLHRLIQAWGVNPKRSFRRNERIGDQVDVAIGLTAIDYWLNNGEEFVPSSTFVGPLPPRTGRSTAEIKPVETHFRDAELSRWAVDDESAGGLALSKQGHIPRRVRVGDLIALRAPNSKDPWEIGVVRWARSAGSDDIEIGIQRLAPNANPVLVKTVDENGKESGFLPGILLPAIKPLKQPPTLIVSRSTFKPKLQAHFDDGYHLYALKSRQLTEASSTFEQFKFEI